MAKRKRYTPKPFESAGGVYTKDGQRKADTSANIYLSMLNSEAYKDLTPKQKSLYVYMKGRYFEHGRKPKYDYPESKYPDFEELRNDENFYFSRADGIATGEYTKKNYGRLYADIEALIQHGFIECVMNGKSQKIRSVYRYSNKWQEWKSK